MAKKDDEGQIGKKVDKFVMGALIGGAIGSVLGMTFAPKKGKETREVLKDKGKDLIQKGKEKVGGIKEKGVIEEGKHVFNLVKKKIDKIKDERELSRMVDCEESQKIPHEE